MRFSIVIILFAIFAPILAVPIPGGSKVTNTGKRGGGGGGNSGSHKPGANPNPPAPKAVKPKVAANPGDLVSVEAQHFQGGDTGASGTTDKPHPAIVIHHDPVTHNVHVVPLARKHPEGVPTMPTQELGVHIGPESLVSLAPPKVIHQDRINKALGPPPGGVGLPEKLNEDQLHRLHHELVQAGAIPHPAPESEKEDKHKINKRQLERRARGVPGEDTYGRRITN